MTTDQAGAVTAYVLADSDRADRELALRLEAWRDGWRACELAHGDAYEAGYTDAQADQKAREHGWILDTQAHLAMWDGLRENFAQPRPGDYPGTGGAT